MKCQKNMKIVKFISKNKNPEPLEFVLSFNMEENPKSYFLEHNKIYELPINVIDHVNRCGNNNIKGRDKYELISMKKIFVEEEK